MNNRLAFSYNSYLKLLLFLLLWGLFALNAGSTFGGKITLFHVILLLSVITFLVIFSKKFYCIKMSMSIILYMSFVFFALLSVLWATSAKQAISGVKVIILTLAILIIYNYIINDVNIDIFNLFSIVCLAGLCTFIYLAMRYGLNVIWTLRSESFVGKDLYNANMVGIIYAISALCGFIRAQNISTYKLLFRAISTFLVLLAVLTVSKTAIIFLFLFGAVLFFIGFPDPKEKIILVILLFLLLGLLYLVVMWIPFFNNILGSRFGEIFKFFGGELPEFTSTWYRYQMMQRGIGLFLQKPLLGYGMANAAVYNVFPGVYESGTYLHSNYLELLADLGLLGTIPYYTIHIWSLRMNIKLYREGDVVSKYFIAFIVAVLITDIFTVSYFDRVTMILIIQSFIYGEQRLQKLIQSDYINNGERK